MNETTKTTEHDSLLQGLHSIATNPGQIDETKRRQIIAACEAARTTLENPVEFTMRTLMQPTYTIALRMAVDMKLCDAAISEAATTDSVTIDGLAARTKAEPLLITRFMRLMCGVELPLFEETAPSTFKIKPLARAYVGSSPLTAMVIHITAQAISVFHLPSFFEENGYKSPDDAYNGPFQHARKTQLHSFEWLAGQPRLQNAFNVVMSTFRKQRGLCWFDSFPVESLAADDPAHPVLVDVGGGIGHDLVSLKEKHPDLPSRMILQDIPAVIKDVHGLPHGIEAMQHNFFDPQPVVGSRAYLLGNVLHDWPDKQAHQILGHIRDAMDSDSKLLIWENVLPETNVSQLSAAIDLQMMAGLSALERTLAQYTALLEHAGLSLVKAWGSDGAEAVAGGQTLLEAVKK